MDQRAELRRRANKKLDALVVFKRMSGRTSLRDYQTRLSFAVITSMVPVLLAVGLFRSGPIGAMAAVLVVPPAALLGALWGYYTVRFGTLGRDLALLRFRSYIGR